MMTTTICQETEKTMRAERLSAPTDKGFLELENRFRRAVGEEPMDQAAQTRLQEAIRRGSLVVFLLWRGERAVGLCTVSTGFSTFACRPQGVFDDFYVEPAFRGQGGARLLAEAAKDWCRAQGFSGLTVTCSSGDEGMYRSLGFDLPLGQTLAWNF